MSCKPIGVRSVQRDEPPGSGSGWTTQSATATEGTTWTVRARYTVFGSGIDCTGWMHFEYSRDGGAWVEFAYVKYADPGSQQWYEKLFSPPGTGSYELRVVIDYDGAQWEFQNEISFVVLSAARGEIHDFLVEGEFAAQATVDGAAVLGVLVEEAEEPEALEGTRPVLVCSADDVATVQHGASVQVGGVSYTVRRIRGDGQGMARLFLERLSGAPPAADPFGDAALFLDAPFGVELGTGGYGSGQGGGYGSQPYGGLALRGLLTEGSPEEAELEGRACEFVCREEDAATLPHGYELTGPGGQTYRIRARERDGSGFVTLLLERESGAAHDTDPTGELASFFDPSEFGVQAEIAGMGVVVGNLDWPREEVDDVEGERVWFVCQAASVAGIAHGTTVNLPEGGGVVAYRVVAARSDGSGLTELELERMG